MYLSKVLPAQDGTGTRVDRDSDRLDVVGRTQASKNLFIALNKIKRSARDTILS